MKGAPQASCVSAREREKDAAKNALAALGFKVEEGGRVEGLSGYKHHFALVARKGKEVVCVDLVSDELSLLASFMKALDLRGVKVLVGVNDSSLRLPSKPNPLRIFKYTNVETLKEELTKALS